MTLAPIADRSFMGETVPVDGQTFIRCNFDDCAFVFSGEGLFNFVDCRIADDCRLQLDGSAKRTINVLRGLIESGGPWADLAADIGRRLTEPVKPETRAN